VRAGGVGRGGKHLLQQCCANILKRATTLRGGRAANDRDYRHDNANDNDDRNNDHDDDQPLPLLLLLPDILRPISGSKSALQQTELQSLTVHCCSYIDDVVAAAAAACDGCMECCTRQAGPQRRRQR